MLPVCIVNDSIRIGSHFSVTFQRTLRIPDDGRTYPLPPGLGRFPVMNVADYAGRVPDSWEEHGGVFIPMYQREALWLAFDGAEWKPNAVKVGVGKINALSAGLWDQALHATKQDYLVVPDQPWLDGINAGRDWIRQFVAMPLGMGYTVEGQLTGSEESGGIQLIVYEPKPGRFPDTPPASRHRVLYDCCAAMPSSNSMGISAGGKMRQKIYPDRYGFDCWDPGNFGRVYIHIVNSAVFREITGQQPPPTPVSVRMYSSAGLPWFDLYDGEKGDLDPAAGFDSIQTVKQMDKSHGFSGQQDDQPVEIKKGQEVSIGGMPVKEGTW